MHPLADPAPTPHPQDPPAPAQPAGPAVGPPDAPEVQPPAEDPVRSHVAGDDPWTGPDPRLLIDFF